MKKGESGPGAFAYSPLDATMAGTAANPAFPLGGSASYMGETVAIMDEDALTGTASVDVGWASSADINFDLGDQASNAGRMTLTLGGLADSTGDPLTFFASGTDAAGSEGREIAEIIFAGMTIEVGLAGGQSGRLIVGSETEGAGDAAGTYTYGELGRTPSTDVRYRLASLGETDLSRAAGATNGDVPTGVGALFVG